MKRAEVVTAYFSEGAEFTLSTIIGVPDDSEELFLEPGPDKRANRNLLQARGILFVTHEGAVKIKFTTERIDETERNGIRVLRAGIPEFLVRLQRREFFRIPTSVVNPVRCCFRFEDGRETTATLLDISIGGVCLLDDQQTLDFRPGKRYEDCRIELPGHGTLDVGLEVRNTAETNKVRNGKTVRRAGCQFLKLPPQGESIVQRYIMSLEMAHDMRQGRRILVKR